ncbi:DUF1187 family protein [Enterobacter roggenkampii]|nr:DUF1187 family protein [Escherichia coli]
MYRITAVINKAGGAPVSWTFYSGRRMTLGKVRISPRCEIIVL